MSISFREPLALAVLLIGGACSGARDSVAPQSIDAPTIVVRSSAVRDLRFVSGTVRSTTVSPLSAKVMGNVTRVLVSEGERVRAGQPLLEIESADLRARGAQTRAGAAEADDAIAAADAAVRAAEANAKLAGSTFTRYEALRSRGSASPQEFDEVSSKNAAAQAQLDQARRSREQAVSRRAQARASVAEADAFVGYSTVRSPIDGIVTARMIDPGAQAAPGMPLLTVEDSNAYRIESVVDESLAAAVRAGDEVVIDCDGRQISARVATIVPAVDPATRSALVKIALPHDAALRSGTFVRVGFATGSRKTLVVPPSAISRRGELTSVYVVDSGRIARMRIVTVGEPRGGTIEVLTGLDDGERIVSAPPAALSDGMRIGSAP